MRTQVAVSPLVSRTLIGSALAIATLGLLGRLADAPALYAFLQGSSGMGGSTAALLILGATAGLLASAEHGRAPLVARRLALVTLVLLVALLTPISQRLGIESPSPISAVAIALFAMVLLVRHRLGPAWIGTLLAGAGGLVGYLGIYGYAVEATSLYAVGETARMAFETGSALVLLGAGLLAGDPGVRGWLGTDALTPMRRLVTRLAPTALALPFVLLGIRLVMETGGRATEAAWPWMAGVLTLLAVGGALTLTLVEVGRLERTQREHRARLEEARLHLETMLDASLDHIYVQDWEGRFVYASASGAAAFGLSRETMQGLTWQELDLPLYLMQQDVARVLVNGTPVAGEMLFRAGDEAHFYEYGVSPMRPDDGVVIGAIITARDVSARKRAENAVREAKERYDLAVEGSSDGLWDWNLLTNEVYYSSRWKSMLGYSEGEIANDADAWKALVHPDDLPAALESIDAYLTGRAATYALEHRLRHKDGSWRWILSRGACVRDETGRATRFAGSHTDLTARKKAEEAASKLAAIVKSTGDGIMSIDLDGIVTSWNDGCERIYGYTAQEAIGRPFTVLALAGHGGELLETFEAAKTGRQTNVAHARRRRKDGSGVDVSLAISPVVDERGQVIGVSSIVRDITEERRIQDALRQSEARYRLIADNVSDVVVVTDAAGTISYVSPSVESLLQCKPEELIGRKLADLQEGADAPATTPTIEADEETGTPSVTLVRAKLRRKDGAIVWTETSTGRTPGGSDAGAVSVVRDITARKNAEDEILLLNLTLETRVEERTQELAAALRELESFSYSVSHDLRAPLRAIDGFSLALLEDYGDKLDAEGKDDLERVRAATKRMGSLIDDILRLSRVGRADIHRQSVDLSAIAREIAAELRASEPARDATFLIQDDLVADGDPVLLRAVLQNFLDNAWKFTGRHPTALIEVGQERTTHGLAFFVRDDGAGFDPQFGGKLFGAFQRLHTADEFHGNGIGLATVRRIVNRHGGETWAEGQVEKGATFYFTIPKKEST